MQTDHTLMAKNEKDLKHEKEFEEMQTQTHDLLRDGYYDE
jgi:hypothetical protein